MIKPILTDKGLLSVISDHANYYADYQVIDDLRDTAATLNNCAGLAAPQIGHMKRIILVNVQGKATIMINPEIVHAKGKNTFGPESCFSVPSSFQNPKRIKRWYKVKIKYINEAGEHVEKLFKSFEARLLQHEIDHLDGKLIL